MLFDQHFPRYLNATHASFIFCNMRQAPGAMFEEFVHTMTRQADQCAYSDVTTSTGDHLKFKLITGLLRVLLKAIWCSHTKITAPTASPAAIRHSAGVCPRCFLLSPLAISLSGQTICGCLTLSVRHPVKH